jgi:hypothetical protein
MYLGFLRALMIIALVVLDRFQMRLHRALPLGCWCCPAYATYSG